MKGEAERPERRSASGCLRAFARKVADRVIVMAGGAIVEAAEPVAFFTAPRH